MKPPVHDRDALIVHDDGPHAGLGHRRRCEAIGAALARLGWRVHLAALQPGARVPDAAIVVVDSYVRRADEPGWLPVGVLVAALDDLRRDLAVDCVIDPGLAARAADHPAAHAVLAGAEFAIVGDAVIAARRAARSPDTIDRRRVLVTTGAADARGVGADIASAIAESGAGVEVRLVAGPWGAARTPRGVRVVRPPQGLASELVAAGVVVTAGGVTLLESLALGRPTVAVATAENQRANLDGATAAGAAGAASIDDAAATALALLDDAPRRRSLAVAAAALVDGCGAPRVADALDQLAAARRARTTEVVG